jgi:hypothetical protein
MNKLYNISRLLSVWTYYNIAKNWSLSSEVGLNNREIGRIFLLSMSSRSVLGPTQPLTQWILRDLTLGVRSLGHEADDSPTTSSEA